MKKYNRNYETEAIETPIENDEVQAPIAERELQVKVPRSAKVTNCRFLNVREGIDTDSNVKKTIKVDTIVKILEDINNDKCKISIDGITGYVPYKFLMEV